MTGRIGGLLRGPQANRVLTFADQGLSSASNMLLSVAIASSVSASAFGRFAILYSIYLLLLGLARAAVLDPLLITSRNVLSGAPVHLIAVAGTAVLGVLGIPIGLVLLATPLEASWGVFFLALPFLLLQDALRYVAFLSKRPGRAVLLDTVWLVVMAVAAALSLTGVMTGTASIIASWGLGALVSVLVGLAVFRLKPERLPLRTHMKSVWPVSGPLIGDFGLSSASSQILVFMLPLVAGTALLGSLKAAQVANGPLHIATAAAAVICLPLVADAVDAGNGPRAALRIGRLAGATLAVVALSYGALLLLMPDGFGRALFGESWGTGWLVAAVSLQQVAIGAMQGALLILRGSRNTRRALHVRLAITPVNVLVPVLLTAVWGRAGLIAGIVGTASVTAVIWWVIASRIRIAGAGAGAGVEGGAADPAPRGPLPAPGEAEASTVDAP